MNDRRVVALHVSAPPFEDDDGWLYARECRVSERLLGSGQ